VGQTGGYRGQTGGVGEGFVVAPLDLDAGGVIKPIFIVSIDFLLYRCSLLDIQRIYFLVLDIYNKMKTISYILTILFLCIGCDGARRVQRKSHNIRLLKLERQINYTQPHQTYHDRPRAKRYRNVSGHRPFISYPTPK
jgi:hypothetical protein